MTIMKKELELCHLWNEWGDLKFLRKLAMQSLMKPYSQTLYAELVGNNAVDKKWLWLIRTKINISDGRQFEARPKEQEKWRRKVKQTVDEINAGRDEFSV